MSKSIEWKQNAGQIKKLPAFAPTQARSNQIEYLVRVSALQGTSKAGGVDASIGHRLTSKAWHASLPVSGTTPGDGLLIRRAVQAARKGQTGAGKCEAQNQSHHYKKNCDLKSQDFHLAAGNEIYGTTAVGEDVSDGVGIGYRLNLNFSNRLHVLDEAEHLTSGQTEFRAAL